MSGRLKFLLAVLAVGAGLSFWYALRSTLTTATISDSITQPTPTPANCNDQDGDGLCDYDETYWNTDFKNPDTDGDGYKDGEEVLSGHDPAKAGPNDFLDNKRNLTQRASTLLMGGVAAGNLDPKNPTYNTSVDDLVDEIFNQYTTNVASELDSIAVASTSRDNLMAYSFKMASILAPMFTEISANYRAFLATAGNASLADLPKLNTTQPSVFQAFVASADSEAVAFEDRIRTLKSIRVPTPMVDFHRSLILYLRGTQQRYRAVKNIASDPLMGVISLQVLNTLTSETPLDLTLAFQHRMATTLNSK